MSGERVGEGRAIQSEIAVGGAGEGEKLGMDLSPMTSLFEESESTSPPPAPASSFAHVIGQEFVLHALHESSSLDMQAEIQRSPSCASNTRRIDRSSNRFSNTSVRSSRHSAQHQQHAVGSRVCDRPREGRGNSSTGREAAARQERDFRQLDLEVLKSAFSEDVAQISVADDVLAAQLSEEIEALGESARVVRFEQLHSSSEDAPSSAPPAPQPMAGFLRGFSLTKGGDFGKLERGRSFRRSKSDAETSSPTPGLPRPARMLGKKSCLEDREPPVLRGVISGRSRSKRAQHGAGSPSLVSGNVAGSQ